MCVRALCAGGGDWGRGRGRDHHNGGHGNLRQDVHSDWKKKKSKQNGVADSLCCHLLAMELEGFILHRGETSEGVSGEGQQWPESQGSC